MTSLRPKNYRSDSELQQIRTHYLKNLEDAIEEAFIEAEEFLDRRYIQKLIKPPTDVDLNKGFLKKKNKHELYTRPELDLEQVAKRLRTLANEMK